MSVKKIVLADGTVRYRVRVYVGRELVEDANGRKRFRQEVLSRTFVKKKDADQEERRLKGQKDGGIVVISTREPLAKYLRQWLNQVMKGRIRARTWDDYSSTLKRYLEEPPKDAPRVGKVRVERVSAGAIQSLYAFLQEEEGLSPRTVRSLHAVVRQGLQYATRTGTVARNVADLVVLPRQDRRKVEAMSQEEANSFLESARKDRYYALWCVLLTCGLRPGEALALKWEDVDLDEKKVHVQRTLTRRGLDRKKYPKGWALVEPKTDQARRVIPLPPFSVKAIREWKAIQARERLLLGGEYENNGLVFTNEFGRPLDGANLYTRNFRRIMGEAGLGTWGPELKKPATGPAPKRPFTPKYRLYDLRHTAATLLLRQGVHPKAVSERLGHGSTAFTMDVYSASVPDMQEEAAARMEAMFGAGS